MSNSHQPPQIEIFKPGTFTSVEGEAMTFTSADMIELAESYDAATNPAPLVIGHPGMADPAYGWAKALRITGDTLVADTEQVESSFAQSVNAGRYKKISAQIYPREHPANPTPGKLHLKHIGFFGAHPVAVKGLRPVSFSEAQQAGCITFEFPNHTPQQQEAILADNDKDKAALASFAERDAALKAREDKIASDEAALTLRTQSAAKAESDARHAANISFAEGVIGAGKFRPTAKDELVHVLDCLCVPEVMSFGEGEKAARPINIVKRWFDQAAPLVSFGEFAKDDGARGGGLLSFAAPAGFEVDQGRAALHQAALALQTASPSLSYADAVTRAQAAQ